MKMVSIKTVDCNSQMKLANPVTNCFGIVVFSARENMTECVKEALLEMGIYQLDVLISDNELSDDVSMDNAF